MFIISPESSFRFAIRDSLLPNYDNQLYQEREQAGLKIIPNHCQLVNNGDERTIQIRTDYDGAITAVLRDNSDNSTAVLTVTEKKTYTSFSTYEFTHTFNANGSFSIIVNGADSIQDAVEYESELIDVATEHKYTLLVKFYNDTNTEFVDYSTGIQHFMRIPSRIPDGEDETDQDIYDKQNQKTKTYAATTFNGELTTGELPEYKKRQLRLASNLFFFFVNDKQYTVTELSSERFGKSTTQQMTLICAEYVTPGVNADDSGQSVIPEPEDMENTYPINLEGVSGSQQLTVAANYLPEIIIFVLKTGTSGTVKVGVSIGGDEVSSPKPVTTASPVYTLGREYLKSLAQYENSFILYFTIVGVGVTVDINTIISKYK